METHTDTHKNNVKITKRGSRKKGMYYTYPIQKFSRVWYINKNCIGHKFNNIVPNMLVRTKTTQHGSSYSLALNFHNLNLVWLPNTNPKS